MAKLVKKKNQKAILLSKQEAIEIISFLTAQLAGGYVPNNTVGICPSIELEGTGKLFFSISKSES